MMMMNGGGMAVVVLLLLLNIFPLSSLHHSFIHSLELILILRYGVPIYPHLPMLMTCLEQRETCSPSAADLQDLQQPPPATTNAITSGEDGVKGSVECFAIVETSEGKAVHIFKTNTVWPHLPHSVHDAQNSSRKTLRFASVPAI